MIHLIPVIYHHFPYSNCHSWVYHVLPTFRQTCTLPILLVIYNESHTYIYINIYADIRIGWLLLHPLFEVNCPHSILTSQVCLKIRYPKSHSCVTKTTTTPKKNNTIERQLQGSGILGFCWIQILLNLLQREMLEKKRLRECNLGWKYSAHLNESSRHSITLAASGFERVT